MTTTIRRLTAAVALPAAMMLTFTACGDDESSSSDDTSNESDSNNESDSESEAGAEGEASPETTDEGAEMPDAGAIPDPVEDPEGFEDYLEQMYVDSGLPAEQADCMAGAFMDNIDVSSITGPEDISGMMGDPELTKAMESCM